MPKPPERIAVVGWGSLSPLGTSADATWRAVLSGASGIASLTQDWAADLPSRIAGCVDESGLSDLEPLLRRRSDRCAQLAVMAARQTWTSAEQRAGLNSNGWLSWWEPELADLGPCTSSTSSSAPRAIEGQSLDSPDVNSGWSCRSGRHDLGLRGGPYACLRLCLGPKP